MTKEKKSSYKKSSRRSSPKKHHHHHKKESSFLNKAYDFTSQVGTAHAAVMLVFAAISCIVLVAVGIYFLQKKDSVWVDTTAIIISPVVVPVSQAADGTYFYEIAISFIVDGEGVYPGIISYYTKSILHGGQKVNVSYLKSNPEVVKQYDENSIPNWEVGLILILIGLFTLLVAAGYFYLTKRYKAFASLGGITTIEGAVLAPFMKK